jgi:hypothetical protein
MKTMLISVLFPFLLFATPPSSTGRIPSENAGYPSLEALVEAAIAGLNAKDTSALSAMAFSRKEFLRAYPLFESDTSSSRREFACNFYLEDNRKILHRLIQQSGGNAFEVSRIEAQAPDTNAKGLALSRGIKVWVRQGDREFQLRLLKSASQTESGWKIWSFTDD